ncbi:MAG: serine hydrolase domain-containing protein [Pseudomonadota bacterium]
MHPITATTLALVLALGTATERAFAEQDTSLAALREKLGITSVLFLSRDERDLAFKHFDTLFPARTIEASDAPYALALQPGDFSALHYRVDDTAYVLEDFLQMRESRGLLVWQNGRVLLEYYAQGHDQRTRWVSFSIAKSVTSMLIGAAIRDGYIASVDEPVTHYVPRFRGTNYEGVTIKHVLQMASGVDWNEDYTDPQSDVARAGAANGIELVRYLGQLDRGAPPGDVFLYNTGETNLAGEILRAAIGNNAATYLTHKIWQPFGMGSEASWLLGKAGGGETGGCCISATLRDYARLGIFALRGGRLADGTRVLPERWMGESTTPSRGSDGYGYLWWLDVSGSFRARGIFGQQIFIDPRSSLVIAVHSNAPTAVGSRYHEHLEALVAALAKMLGQP